MLRSYTRMPRWIDRGLSVLAAVALALGGAGAAAAQEPPALSGADLERLCLENAPDEATRDDCLAIVRTILAPGGVLLLPEPGATRAPGDAPRVGATQATSSLLVTLLAFEWDAALFSGEDSQIVAAELAFESTHPEAYVDTGGLSVVDQEGFSHTWGAIHRMGESPPGGFLPEGRRQRGWVGFEVPAGTRRIELEYRGSDGERLVWTVER